MGQATLWSCAVCTNSFSHLLNQNPWTCLWVLSDCTWRALEGDRSSDPTGEPSEWDAISYVARESSLSAGLTASLSEPPELVIVSVQVLSARPSWTGLHPEHATRGTGALPFLLLADLVLATRQSRGEPHFYFFKSSATLSPEARPGPTTWLQLVEDDWGRLRWSCSSGQFVGQSLLVRGPEWLMHP